MVVTSRQHAAAAAAERVGERSSPYRRVAVQPHDILAIQAHPPGYVGVGGAQAGARGRTATGRLQVTGFPGPRPRRGMLSALSDDVSACPLTGKAHAHDLHRAVSPAGSRHGRLFGRPQCQNSTRRSVSVPLQRGGPSRRRHEILPGGVHEAARWWSTGLTGNMTATGPNAWRPPQDWRRGVLERTRLPRRRHGATAKRDRAVWMAARVGTCQQVVSRRREPQDC
jgi:hypothetical protein